jgi:hypothetical protein
MDLWLAESESVRLTLMGQRDVERTVTADGNRSHVHGQVKQTN